jgi:putative transposase
MYERSTDITPQAKGAAVQSSAEAPDSQGMGDERQRGRSGPEISDSPPDPLPLEKGLRAGCGDLPQWQASSNRSKDQRARGGESETEGNTHYPDPRAYAVEKKDELGLVNRPKGSTFSRVQRERVKETVESLKGSGIKKTEALRTLGVCRSTYYGWFKEQWLSGANPSILSLTESEKAAVIVKKAQQPHLSHRKISGYLRQDGYWISPSSCYRILKAKGWVFPQPLRQAPWKKAHYEPIRPNQLWGEDWTILNVGGKSHYLLTIIDYFSRYIVAWGIVESVTQRDVKDLLVIAFISQGIEHCPEKPLLRMDRGSPNMAHSTKKMIKDLEMVLSPSRTNRPTDNARQERWYRSVKQEEIYCYPSYSSIEMARRSLARYIDEYNESRPHQALWNYTPGYVHRLGNKTSLLKQYKQMVQKAKGKRLEANRFFKLAHGGLSN